MKISKNMHLTYFTIKFYNLHYAINGGWPFAWFQFCAVFLDMQSFLMPPNYFDDGYLAIFLRQLSRRGLLLFYCSQKLTESDTPSSFVLQRFGIAKKSVHILHWLQKEVWKLAINLCNNFAFQHIKYHIPSKENAS